MVGYYPDEVRKCKASRQQPERGSFALSWQPEGLEVDGTMAGARYELYKGSRKNLSVVS